MVSTSESVAMAGGAEAQQQQGNGDQRTEHGFGHGDSLQEQIPLVDVHMGLKNAEGEGQSRV